MLKILKLVKNYTELFSGLGIGFLAVGTMISFPFLIVIIQIMIGSAFAE